MCDVDEVAPGRPNVVGVAEGEPRRADPDALRPHRHRRRGGHGRAVRAGHARRPALRARLAGHEGRRGGDAGRRGRWAASGSSRRRPRDRGRRGRRGVREPRRRGARARLARRRSRDSRADRLERSAIAHKGFSCARDHRARHGPRTAAGPPTAATRSCGWGACSTRLEALDRELQARPTASAAGHRHRCTPGTIRGGTELSIYPAECVLQVERRTLPGEDDRRRAEGSHGRSPRSCAAADPEFTSDVRLVLARPPYATPSGASVTDSLAGAVRARMGVAPARGPELLDRRRDSRRRRHAHGALRPTWCGPAQRRGVRRKSTTCWRAATCSRRGSACAVQIKAGRKARIPRRARPVPRAASTPTRRLSRDAQLRPAGDPI